MITCMYTDKLVDAGLIDGNEWEVMTWDYGNFVGVDIPDNILKSYYEEKVKDDYNGMSFGQWYEEESIADDMDGLFDFTDWRPFLTDITEGLWDKAEYESINQ